MKNQTTILDVLPLILQYLKQNSGVNLQRLSRRSIDDSANSVRVAFPSIRGRPLYFHPSLANLRSPILPKSLDPSRYQDLETLPLFLFSCVCLVLEAQISKNFLPDEGGYSR
ncbi:hypothetical protein TNIN_33821 [Trichonephila inaurata madagascariensis]|uniref:Uncharacterized protein n=1 Tax=Trichonephila inaurata madagascariensis TaxID=2747483 RepID=A0A8X6YE39_9ARAC|nr:hypothetical protein TNIN_33821 [Trichonephila inaurata madagascariensis]